MATPSTHLLDGITEESGRFFNKIKSAFESGVIDQKTAESVVDNVKRSADNQKINPDDLYGMRATRNYEILADTVPDEASPVLRELAEDSALSSFIKSKGSVDTDFHTDEVYALADTLRARAKDPAAEYIDIGKQAKQVVPAIRTSQLDKTNVVESLAPYKAEINAPVTPKAVDKSAGTTVSGLIQPMLNIHTMLDASGGVKVSQAIGEGDAIKEILGNRALGALQHKFGNAKEVLNANKNIKFAPPEVQKAFGEVENLAMATGPLAKRKYLAARKSFEKEFPSFTPLLKNRDFDTTLSNFAKSDLFGDWKYYATQNRIKEERAIRDQLPAVQQLLVDNIAHANELVGQAAHNFGEKFTRRGLYFGGAKANDELTRQKWFDLFSREGYKNKDGSQIYQADGRRSLPPKLDEVETQLNEIGLTKFPEHASLDPSLRIATEADREVVNAIERKIGSDFSTGNINSALASTSAKRHTALPKWFTDEVLINPSYSTQMNIRDLSAKTGRTAGILDVTGTIPTSEKHTRIQGIQEAATALSDSRALASSVASRIAKEVGLSTEVKANLERTLETVLSGTAVDKRKTTAGLFHDLIINGLMADASAMFQQFSDIFTVGKILSPVAAAKAVPHLWRVPVKSALEQSMETLNRIDYQNKPLTHRTIAKAVEVISRPMHFVTSRTREYTENAVAQDFFRRFTKDPGAFEANLAKALGPEKAHLIVLDMMEYRDTAGMEGMMQRTVNQIMPAGTLGKSWLEAKHGKSGFIKSIESLRKFMITQFSSFYRDIVTEVAKGGYKPAALAKAGKIVARRVLAMSIPMLVLSWMISKTKAVATGDDTQHKKNFSNPIAIGSRLLTGVTGLPMMTGEQLVSRPDRAVGSLFVPVVANVAAGFVADTARAGRMVYDPEYKPNRGAFAGTLGALPAGDFWAPMSDAYLKPEQTSSRHRKRFGYELAKRKSYGFNQ